MTNSLDKLIGIAMNEVGYLEKKSNAQLDSKTANAGSGNYTKYARDLVKEIGSPYAQGVPWCDMFVDWCFIRAYGKEKAKEMLGGWSAYTPTSAAYYKNKERWHTSPQPGDQIFYINNIRIYHTGIVYDVDRTKVYTIEGNTSGGSGVIANGGGVFKKSYPLDYLRIAGYGRPDYSRPGYGNSPTAPADQADSKADTIVQAGQLHANNFADCGLETDGKYGPLTRKAGVKVLQHAMNLDYGNTIAEDSVWGPKSNSKLGDHYVKRGETQYMVTALEILLMLRRYDPKGVECPGCFGRGLENAVRQYQKDNSLPVTGRAGADTFRKLVL